jgi:hypothetical protein
MRFRIKLLLAGLAAALLLSMAVGGASANRISLSNKNFRDVWTSIELTSETGTIRCPMTIEGSFHSAMIAKVAALVGHITRATTPSGTCTNGSKTINQEALPWHMHYTDYAGTLPAIWDIGFDIVGMKFTKTSGGLTCTSITTTANPARANANLGARGVIIGVRWDETAVIPARGGFFCELAGNWRFAGTGTMTLLGTTTPIAMTLI